MSSISQAHGPYKYQLLMSLVPFRYVKGQGHVWQNKQPPIATVSLVGCELWPWLVQYSLEWRTAQGHSSCPTKLAVLTLLIRETSQIDTDWTCQNCYTVLNFRACLIKWQDIFHLNKWVEFIKYRYKLFTVDRILQPRCHYMSIHSKSLRALFQFSSMPTQGISGHTQQLLWVHEVTVIMNTYWSSGYRLDEP
jgi:hypothetical protein